MCHSKTTRSLFQIPLQALCVFSIEFFTVALQGTEISVRNKPGFTGWTSKEHISIHAFLTCISHSTHVKLNVDHVPVWPEFNLHLLPYNHQKQLYQGDNQPLVSNHPEWKGSIVLLESRMKIRGVNVIMLSSACESISLFSALCSTKPCIISWGDHGAALICLSGSSCLGSTSLDLHFCHAFFMTGKETYRKVLCS